MSGQQGDPLAQLKQALLPKPGMRRIPIPYDTYQHLSPGLANKRLINLFAEKEPPDSRSEFALTSTPGLLTHQFIGSGPIRCMDAIPGVMYVVSGTRLYRQRYVEAEHALEDLGDIGSPLTDINGTFMITMGLAVTGLVVCVPPNAFTCRHDGVLHQIGGTFPGARSVAYLDGYWVFQANEYSTKFFVSLLLDPDNYNALDFAYSDATPDTLVRVIAHRGDVWLMGFKSLEVWYNAGAADFAFRRQAGGVIPYGLIGAPVVGQIDGSVFWQGPDSVVFRSEGYHAKRISTHAIEYAMRRAGRPLDGMTYRQDGHSFYCLSYISRTFVYDCATELWHERQSTDGRWNPGFSCYQGDAVLMGDATSGRIYYPYPELAGDDGVARLRTMILPSLFAGTHRGFINRLEIEMEAGGEYTPGSVRLEWSDDGGNFWKGNRVMLTGSQAQRRFRVFTTRLGSFRSRMFRLTAYGHITVYAIDADIDVGVD